MSRRKKHPQGKRQRQRRPVLTAAEQQQEVVEHTAGVVTSLREITDDFHYLCDTAIAHLEDEVVYTGLGIEVWAGRSEQAQTLVQVLTALLKAQQEHRAALVGLRARLAALLETAHPETLEPPQAWEGLVRERLFPVGLPDPIKPETAAQLAGGAAPRCVVCGEH